MPRRKANSTVSTSANGVQKAVNKTEAVRRVLAQHGKNTKPAAICELVKTEFGLDLTTAHASNIKSTLAKGKKGKKKGRKKGGRKAALGSVTESKSVAKTRNGKGSSGISIQDIETVKSLVGRLKTDALHSLIDVLKN